MLGNAGYLSQFFNFNVVDYGRARDTKRFNSILQGTSRKICSKCGVRVWWIEIPKTMPKPVRFVIATKDKELSEVSISGLSWAFCHDYPNWTGKYISGTI